MSTALVVPPSGADHDEFRRPGLDLALVRAVVGAGGHEEDLVAAQRSVFESLNKGVHEHQARLRHADRRLKEHHAELARLRWQRKFTRAVRLVVVRERIDWLPWLHLGGALLLMTAAFFALAMSNQVGANYIVNSGSDLYATNPEGASLFMGVVVLIAGALKVFEQRLPNDTAKALYSYVLFAIGIGASLLWIAAMAVTFAPDAADSTTWLTGENAAGSRQATTVLLLAHLIADVTCGYAIFSGAEQMALAGRKRELHPNPLHQHLTRKVNATWAAVRACEAEIGAAEDFLRRYAAASDAIERQARIAYRCETQRLEQQSHAAAAEARSLFLRG